MSNFLENINFHQKLQKNARTDLPLSINSCHRINMPSFRLKWPKFLANNFSSRKREVFWEILKKFQIESFISRGEKAGHFPICFSESCSFVNLTFVNTRIYICPHTKFKNFHKNSILNILLQLKNVKFSNFQNRHNIEADQIFHMIMPGLRADLELIIQNLSKYAVRKISRLCSI